MYGCRSDWMFHNFVMANEESALIVQPLGDNTMACIDHGLFRITCRMPERLSGYTYVEKGTVAAAEFSEEAVLDALKTYFDLECPSEHRGSWLGLRSLSQSRPGWRT